jgi:predicted MFS family arabinose efflux permease
MTQVLSPAAAGIDSERAWTRVALPLGALTACALVVLMQIYVAIPLAPVAGDDLGGSASAALATTFALAYAVGFLVFGPLSDQYGRKVVLIPGLLAMAVSTAALSAAPSIEALAALRALQGLSAATFAPVALAYITESMPPRWRTTAIGTVSTSFLVAGIAGQVYGSAIASAWGWRWVFVVEAIALALAAPALAAVLREPRRAAPAGPLAERFRQLPRLARRRELLPLFGAAFTLLLAFVAMYSALGPELADRFGLDDDGTLLVRLAGLPGMLVAPAAGALAGRFGPARLVVAGFGIAALGLAAEAIAAGALWALVVASVVFVAGIATAVPGLITLVGSRAGEARAGGIAVYGFVLFVGASVGPLVTEVGLGFTGLLLALAALLGCAAALVAASE